MLIFGLAQFQLFFFGIFCGSIQTIKSRDIFIKLASILVIAFGFYIAYLGYEYLTDPTKSILSCHI